MSDLYDPVIRALALRDAHLIEATAQRVLILMREQLPHLFEALPPGSVVPGDEPSLPLSADIINPADGYTRDGGWPKHDRHRDARHRFAYDLVRRNRGRIAFSAMTTQLVARFPARYADRNAIDVIQRLLDPGYTWLTGDDKGQTVRLYLEGAGTARRWLRNTPPPWSAS